MATSAPINAGDYFSQAWQDCFWKAPQIRAIRSRTQMSQAVFAAVLNTSVSTVQKWEIGEKRPSGPSLKLLNVIERKGIKALA